MSEYKVLYQIKTLEKMILRKFLKDKELEQEEACVTLAPTQMQIIGYILEHSNDNIYQKDLEDILKLRRATVSGVLHTMEKNELIERITNSEDTRTKKIILNSKAKEIFSRNEKKLDELEKIIIQDISKEDLEVFSKVIDIMKENIEKQTINKNNIYIRKDEDID